MLHGRPETLPIHQSQQRWETESLFLLDLPHDTLPARIRLSCWHRILPKHMAGESQCLDVCAVPHRSTLPVLAVCMDNYWICWYSEVIYGAQLHCTPHIYLSQTCVSIMQWKWADSSSNSIFRRWSPTMPTWQTASEIEGQPRHGLCMLMP